MICVPKHTMDDDILGYEEQEEREEEVEQEENEPSQGNANGEKTETEEAEGTEEALQEESELKEKSAGSRRANRFQPYSKDKHTGAGDKKDVRRNRVFISNIPHDIQGQAINDLMREKVGELTCVELFKDGDGKSMGCGVVEFKDEESVKKAIELMNKHDLNGRHLNIKEDPDGKKAYGVLQRSAGMYQRGRGRDGGPGGMNPPPPTANNPNIPPDVINSQQAGRLDSPVSVANLDFNVGGEKLKEVFSMADIKEGEDNKSRGMGTVTFKQDQEAVQAISMFDGRMLFDRPLHIKMDDESLPSEDFRLDEKSPQLLSGIWTGLGSGGHPINTNQISGEMANMSPGDEEGIEFEPELEEDVSESEDSIDPDFDPDHCETDQSTDGEVEAPEEDAYGEEAAEEEDDEDEEVIFKSKDGNLLWYSSIQNRGRSARVGKIKMTPGPTRYATSRVHDIKSSFELFLPESIVKIILKMTNLEGRRVFAGSWKALDQIDLQAYIGLLILAGVYRSHNEAMRSLWDAESGRPIFRSTMSVRQFTVLARVIRFDDKATRPQRQQHDKLAAIRDVWDLWVERLPLMYNPGPEVTVDERLVSFRGRCPFKQYIKSKSAKYGIKIWAACDARSSYAWNMQVYTGKPVTGKSEKNQGMRVVLDMTAGLMGHNITCDNFFTSYALGQELLKRKLTMVGTLRKNKPELPPAMLSTKGRKVLSSKFVFTDTHCLVSYFPKKSKNVVLMSTLHKDTAVSTEEHRKPHIILDYNRNKGGVDCLDKLTGTYTCQRKTARWPVVLFSNILDVSAYNAYVVWTAIDPAWNPRKKDKRRLFLAELGKALVTPLIQRRQHLPRTPASASLVKSLQPPAPAPASANLVKSLRVRASIAAPPALSPKQGQKRKRCRFCGPQGNKTRFTCINCHAYICGAHSNLILTCPSCV